MSRAPGRGRLIASFAFAARHDRRDGAARAGASRTRAGRSSTRISISSARCGRPLLRELCVPRARLAEALSRRERPDRARCLAACGASAASGAVLPFRLDYVVKIGTLRRMRGVKLGLEAIALSIISLGLVDSIAFLPLSISATATSSSSFRIPLMLVVLFGVGACGLLVGGRHLVRLPFIARRARLAKIAERVAGHPAGTRASRSPRGSSCSAAGRPARSAARCCWRRSASASRRQIALVVLCLAAAAALIPIASGGAIANVSATAAVLLALGVHKEQAINFGLASGMLLCLTASVAAIVGVATSLAYGRFNRSARPRHGVAPRRHDGALRPRFDVPYGAGSGSALAELKACTPASLSPSNGVRAVDAEAEVVGLGSANQTPIAVQIDALPAAVDERRREGFLDDQPQGRVAVAAAFVLKSPMYSAAPNGEPACSSRKTVYSRFGGRSRAAISNVSKPCFSVVSPTLTCSCAPGMQAASCADEGVRAICSCGRLLRVVRGGAVAPFAAERRRRRHRRHDHDDRGCDEDVLVPMHVSVSFASRCLCHVRTPRRRRYSRAGENARARHC